MVHPKGHGASQRSWCGCVLPHAGKTSSNTAYNLPMRSEAAPGVCLRDLQLSPSIIFSHGTSCTSNSHEEADLLNTDLACCLVAFLYSHIHVDMALHGVSAILFLL